MQTQEDVYGMSGLGCLMPVFCATEACWTLASSSSQCKGDKHSHTFGGILMSVLERDGSGGGPMLLQEVKFLCPPSNKQNQGLQITETLQLRARF